MKDKCPICMSCLHARWIGTKRYYWCDFCDKYYIMDADGVHKLNQMTLEIITDGEEEAKQKE